MYPYSTYQQYSDFAKAQESIRVVNLYNDLLDGGLAYPMDSYYAPWSELTWLYKALDQLILFGYQQEIADTYIDRIIALTR